MLSKFHSQIWSLIGTVAVAVAFPRLIQKVTAFGLWCQRHTVAVATLLLEVVALAEVRVEFGRFKF